MADGVVQAPAVQGVEAAVFHQQLQVFLVFLLCVLAFLFICYRSFASSYVSLIFLFCTLASLYLAPSPSRVHRFPFYIFRFASFVAAYLPFAYFSCHPGMFLFSSLIIFHVLVHSFVAFCPECGLRSHGDFIAFYCILFPR